MEPFDDKAATGGGLPIADYDHLPKLAVESRARSLGPDELEALLRYECSHRARTPVIRVLAARLRQVRERRRRQAVPGGYGPLPPAARQGRRYWA